MRQMRRSAPAVPGRRPALPRAARALTSRGRHRPRVTHPDGGDPAPSPLASRNLIAGESPIHTVALPRALRARGATRHRPREPYPNGDPAPPMLSPHATPLPARALSKRWRPRALCARPATRHRPRVTHPNGGARAAVRSPHADAIDQKKSHARSGDPGRGRAAAEVSAVASHGRAARDMTVWRVPRHRRALPIRQQAPKAGPDPNGRAHPRVPPTSSVSASCSWPLPPSGGRDPAPARRRPASASARTLSGSPHTP